MESLIYVLPKSEKQIDIKEFDIYFDEQPSPKLIKYGFNNINDELDLITLTSTPYYKVGLNFDFDRTDDNSINVKASTIFKTNKFDIDFAEFWEVLNIFEMLNLDQKIYTNISSIKEICVVHQKISNTNHKFTYIEKNESKPNATLIIYKYSSADIDENAAIQFIINNLSNLLAVQTKGANMILQLFSLQTQISAEIIYYLSTLYNESYLMKPSISSNISDSKYLILIGLKNLMNLSIPSHPDNIYLTSIGLKTLPNELVTIIQCMNSSVIPNKYKKYNQIKEYLDTKVYEGATYQELIQAQDLSTDKWLQIFYNLDNMKALLNKSLENSSIKCNAHLQLLNLINR